MKKFTLFLLIFLCVSLYSFEAKGAPPDTFKEGVYKLSNLKPSSHNIYIIKSISDNERIFIFDDKGILQFSSTTTPSSAEIQTLPILPSYSIFVVGNGEVSITPKTTVK